MKIASRVAYRFCERFSTEFDTEEALKKYLKDHPDADPSNHSVKKSEGEGKKKEEEDDTPVKGSKELGEMMSQWHSSGSDPIYAVSSTLYAGKPVAKKTVSKARKKIQTMIPDAEAGMYGWTKDDVASLKKMDKQLGDMLK